MRGKNFRWFIISGVIIIFAIAAILRKETPQMTAVPISTQPPTISQSVLHLKTPANPDLIDEAIREIAANPVDPNLTHTVQAGETLFSIAQQYNVNLEALAQINQVLDTSQIMVGQVLVISGELDTGDMAETAVIPTISATSQPVPPQVKQTANTLNGLPFAAFISLSPETRQHIDEIYAQGQEMGRNAHAFSKLGDSTIMAPGLLVQFDQGAYNLADFAYLQPIIDQYAGSFERYGAATHVGLHSWTVFDPMIADTTWCLSNENVLACELRLQNPSILFIRLGSNDAGIPDSFAAHTRTVVQTVIDNGVIPIIGTKADRFEGEDNINNQILRQIAAEYKVPLWDFDTLAATLPNRGLTLEDNVHLDKLTITNDYAQPSAYQSGQAMQDLSALLMLEAIWQEINN